MCGVRSRAANATRVPMAWGGLDHCGSSHAERHIAERHIAERHIAERHIAEPTDSRWRRALLADLASTLRTDSNGPG